MSSPRDQNRDQRQSLFTLALIGVIGQVGCVTLIIVLLVILLGLWLDRQLGTRPVFTLIFVFGSIPVTIFTMLFLVRKGVDRIKGKLVDPNQQTKEEDHVGRD